MRPYPETITSKTAWVSSGLWIDISKAAAYLINEFNSSTLSAGGLAVVNTTVYHRYALVFGSSSVNVIDPVY